MGSVVKRSNMGLFQASLTFIHLQLFELTRDCGDALQNRLVDVDYLLELKNKLQKILHETCSACSPPVRKPVNSDFLPIRCIGKGAFGAVDLVRLRTSDRNFAMKNVKKRNVTKKLQSLVYLERDILSFSSNPFIVSMFCSFETEANWSMVMEHVGDADCATLLQTCRRFPADVSRVYVAETVLALEYIHSYGIVHRDLKPSNLLITFTGHIKLADFGIAKIGPVNMKTDLSEVHIEEITKEFVDTEVLGTVHYISPEVFLKVGYGKPVDWWSLGIVLYEFLVGTVPFNDHPEKEVHQQVIEDEVTWPRGKNGVAAQAQNFISLLLEKFCEDRLGTRGVQEVKEHHFFQDLDWDHLLNLKVPWVEARLKSFHLTDLTSDPSEEESDIYDGSNSYDEDNSSYDDDYREMIPVKTPPAFCSVAFSFTETPEYKRFKYLPAVYKSSDDQDPEICSSDGEIQTISAPWQSCVTSSFLGEESDDCSSDEDVSPVSAAWSSHEDTSPVYDDDDSCVGVKDEGRCQCLKDLAARKLRRAENMDLAGAVHASFGCPSKFLKRIGRFFGRVRDSCCSWGPGVGD